MRNLLSAGMSRLRLSKIFWLGIAFMFGMGFFIVSNQYYSCLKYGFELPTLDNFILGYTVLISIVAAVFSSLFFGTEYSDGTMRNKLLVGHSRVSIYFSSLFINIIATLLMCLAYLAGVCLVGIPLFGGLQIALPPFLAMFFGSIMTVCAICAILTALCMMITSKAIVSIVSVLGVVGLLLFAINTNSRLTEPEFYPPGMYITTEGGYEPSGDPIPNLNFLTGTKRKVYEYAYDIVPTGQAYQYASMRAEHLWQMPLYSLALVLLSTSVGLFFFKRKDLK